MDYASYALDRHDTGDDHVPEMPAIVRKAAASLSVIERSVVSLSLQDTVESISVIPHRRASIARLFGHEQPNRLGSKPLEELRRFSILARVRGEIDASMLRRFLDAGYTTEQADLVVHFLATHAPKRAAIASPIGVLLFVVISAIGIFLLMQTVLEEPMISTIVAGLTIATLASVAAPRDHRAR